MTLCCTDNDSRHINLNMEVKCVCMKFSFFIGLGVVYSVVNASDNYKVDCSIAQYDYVDAGRVFDGDYGAKGLSDCLKTCEQICGTSPELTTLNCLKDDAMAGCSYLVKMTRYTSVPVKCKKKATSGLYFEIVIDDMMGLKYIPVSYSVKIPDYNQGTKLLGAVLFEDDGGCYNSVVPTIPVPCDDDSVCDITDLIVSSNRVPPNPNGKNENFYIKLDTTDPEEPPPRRSEHLAATYITAGMVPAIALNTCSLKTSCGACAAAKCNWCDNSDRNKPETASGYRGCGVSHDECESLGVPFDNCEGYSSSGASEKVSRIGIVPFTLLAALSISL